MAINTMTVTAGDMFEVLEASFKAQLEHGYLASHMLHGEPGIGKTQLTEQLAAAFGAKLYDIRLTTIEPSDLRGLPYYDHETKQTVFYRPNDLPDSEEPAVLFFDELTAASPFLQPTIYGALQERRIGQHKIPDNVFIVAAGNGVEDGAVSYEMGTALADRLVHYRVVSDPKDWTENWAIKNDVHPTVIAFIKIRPDLLNTTQQCLKNQKLIATTPRSWKRVSDIMKLFPQKKIRSIKISGVIGDSIANEFFIVADDVEATVQVEEMLKKPRAERVAMYPKTMHGLNAMILGLVGSAREDNLAASIEIMLDIRSLSKLRSEEDFKKHPLAELSTYGLETFFAKVMDPKRGIQNADMKLISLPVYKEYFALRKDAGLTS
jgi:hypothetical protein